MRAGRQANELHTLFANIEHRLADFDDLRLATMDAAGIDLSVLSVTTPGIQGMTDAKEAVSLARVTNDFRLLDAANGIREDIESGVFALQGCGRASRGTARWKPASCSRPALG